MALQWTLGYFTVSHNFDQECMNRTKWSPADEFID